MQEVAGFRCTPIAAVESIGADDIEGAGNVVAPSLGKDQQELVSHARTQEAEKPAREIRSSPFARTGVAIKCEKGVPMGLGQVAPGDPLDLDAVVESSPRSRLIVLRLREVRAARKSSNVA